MPEHDETPPGAEEAETGLCSLDLDNLDQVAIALGDQGVHDIRRLVGNRLTSRFGLANVTERAGCPGFFITLRQGDRDAALALVDRTLQEFSGAYGAAAIANACVTARAGIAWTKPETPCSDAELRRRAIVASALAKERRQAREIYGEDCFSLETGARLICDLNAAMDEDRLTILAQEIRDLEPSDPIARQYEILIQMTDGNGQVHPPSEFVPLAERNGMIERLDRWIIRKTLLGFAAELHARPEISLSLNLSGRSLGHADTWTFLDATIRQSGIAPHRVQIEITETSEIGDMQQAAANVLYARLAGCSVALDDFGAGLSGYRYLRSLDVNCIKLDGALIVNLMEPGSIESKIVRSIMALARRLNIEVVAEHVSSQEILDVLRSLGVTRIQGYEVGMPRPLGEILTEH